jgi:hypothetical protein
VRQAPFLSFSGVEYDLKATDFFQIVAVFHALEVDLGQATLGVIA